MRLDQVRIQIRPRSHLETLDLAAAIVRRHAIGLALAAVMGVLPFLAFNIWVFTEESIEADEFGAFVYLMALLAEAPWATAWITLYLGQAAFAPNISTRRIIRDFFGSLGQMFLFQAIVRGMCIVFCVTIPFVPLAMKYANEIILLERSSLGRMYKRLTAFHNRMVARILGETLFDAILGVLMTLLAAWAIRSVTQIWNNSWTLEFREFSLTNWVLFLFPVFTWQGHIATWLVISFFTVARFASYLDCRIRREGWDVELKLRAQAQAMRPAEAA